MLERWLTACDGVWEGKVTSARAAHALALSGVEETAAREQAALSSQLASVTGERDQLIVKLQKNTEIIAEQEANVSSLSPLLPFPSSVFPLSSLHGIGCGRRLLNCVQSARR